MIAPAGTERPQHELDVAVPGGFTLRLTAGAAGPAGPLVSVAAAVSDSPLGGLIERNSPDQRLETGRHPGRRR